MNLYLYLDAVTNLYIFKHKGFVFNPKSGSLMLIERESDGFVNLQALYDNKAFRQNTNGQILSEFIDPSTIVNELGISYGNDAQAIRTALADFFVDAPSGGGGLSVEQVKSQSTTKAPSSKLFADVTGELELNIKTSIASLENTINSANINQETTATVTGVDTISLPKTAANTGMQVQIFGDSDATKNVLGTGRVRSVGNNLIKPTYIQGFQVSTTDGTFVAGATFSRSDYFRVAASTAYILSSNTNTGTDHRIVFYDLNKVFISGSAQTSGQPISVTSPANAYYAIVSSLTTKVDTFRLTRGTASFEQYRESILQLTTPKLRSNGLIKDEIRKGTNGYELVKRVGVGTLGANGIAGGDFEGGLAGNMDTIDGVVTWTLNTTNPISGTQDGRLQVTTIGTNTARPRIRFSPTRSNGQYRKISFSYKVNSGVCILNTYDNGGGVVSISTTLSGSGVFELYYLCLGTNLLALNFNGTNLFDLQIDNVKDELINTPDGVATGSAVTVLGSNIHYTLATPIITLISHAGLLNSNSNGTVYFEPIIADAGVYSTSLAVQLTDYPIASFESIRKYANGTYTELNTATAVIASGGLSFTHPELVSGDLVMFTYAYSKESIGRSMTLTHYDSRFVEADTANGKVYRIVPVVTNGVVSWTAVEV